MNKFKIILIIIIVFVLAVGGYGIWRSQHGVALLPTATSTPEPTLDTTNYQTYQNGEYGFELKFSPDYAIGEWGGCGENCIGFSKTGAGAQDWVAALWVYPGMSYSEVMKDALSHIKPGLHVMTAEERFMMNGVSWTKLTVTDEQDTAHPLMRRYFAEHTGNTYEISLEEFLKTFSFIP